MIKIKNFRFIYISTWTIASLQFISDDIYHDQSMDVYQVMESVKVKSC